MSILVDTSVWVDHFKKRNEELMRLLSGDLVLIHPMVIGELACGTPPAPRVRTLRDLNLLPQCHQASMSEVMAFIENKMLYGHGCGLVDITLLASALITPGATLWTLDKRLVKLANHLNVGYQPVH